MTAKKLDSKPLLRDLIDTLAKLHPSEQTGEKIDPEIAKQSITKINAAQRALARYIEEASFVSSCTKNSNQSVWIIHHLAGMQKGLHYLHDSISKAVETGLFIARTEDGDVSEFECFLNLMSCFGREKNSGAKSVQYFNQLLACTEAILETEIGNLTQFNKAAMDAVAEGYVTEDESYFLFLINSEYASLLDAAREYRDDAIRSTKQEQKAA